jgi:hypothetical protein
VLYTREEKERIREQADHKRNEAEKKITNTNYELIYPSDEFKPEDF